MNRFKKEERRKREEARRGLSKEQVAALDQADLRKAKIEELARQIHAKKFSEEYDYIYDSHVDLQERKASIQ